MATLTPEQMLNDMQAYIENIEKAKRGYVAVGLPSEKIGSRVYGGDMTVVKNGAIHEYGLGNVPRRSFLSVPFMTKKDDISKAIENQFSDVLSKGKPAEQALGLIGVTAVNISKGAFTSRGYGKWPDIEESTKKAKGSSQVLIDKGLLRGSISHVVRGL